MPGLDPGTPDTIEEPHPPEEPVAMSDDEEAADHEEEVFVSRETPGDVQLFRKMALLCGEVLSELTSNESIMIVDNSMSDANMFKEQHKLNNYQRDTLYSLLRITSACRLGREPNPDRFARFAVWLQHARLFIDSRERFDGTTEAQRVYDRHLVDLDNECNTRRILGEAYITAITSAARIVYSVPPRPGVHFGNGTLGHGREPDEETPPPSEARATFKAAPPAASRSGAASSSGSSPAPNPVRNPILPPRNSRAAVDHRTGAVAGAPLGDHTIRRRHFIILSSVQIQQALRYVGVAAVIGDHDQLVDQMVDMSSTTCAQLIYIAHLVTVAPRIPVPMSVYSCRGQASLYITLAKRASQR